MSVFLELISRARSAGATRLQWECDVTDWASDPRRVGRWTCAAVATDRNAVPALATGRTGEEALRELVEAMER